MRNLVLNGILSVSMLFMGCATNKHSVSGNGDMLRLVNQDIADAASQYKLMVKRLPADKFPRTYYESSDRFQTAASGDWVSGFYPGTLVYLYQQTRDETLLSEARRVMQVLEKEKNNKGTHDLGFMMYCSFGNAIETDPRPEDKEILITSARSLASRFNPKVGCIKSWDKVRSWDGKTMWSYPVIIDNMMNLELLFYASKATGDPSFRNIAISHAEKTMQNHVRPDNSSYHVVNYDPETGAVLSRETHQGFSDNSTWSRGEAWGVYGFTMVYRETRQQRFLETAEKMADYFLAHLPADMVPYWDFNAGQPGYTPQWKYDPTRFKEQPRDASAAAVVASALIELSGYVPADRSRKYLQAAEKMIRSLSAEPYKAAQGKNGNFILAHSTGSVPANSEIDVPLTYADYYFIEALKRYKEKILLRASNIKTEAK